MNVSLSFKWTWIISLLRLTFTFQYMLFYCLLPGTPLCWDFALGELINAFCLTVQSVPTCLFQSTSVYSFFHSSPPSHFKSPLLPCFSFALCCCSLPPALFQSFSFTAPPPVSSSPAFAHRSTFICPHPPPPPSDLPSPSLSLSPPQVTGHMLMCL